MNSNSLNNLIKYFNNLINKFVLIKLTAIKNNHHINKITITINKLFIINLLINNKKSIIYQNNLNQNQ